MRNEQLAGVINVLSFRYRKNEAFISAFNIREWGIGNEE
jgi:hypothetical protein